MNIYLLTRIGDTSYGEVIGLVITAEDETAARSLPFAAWEADDPYGTEGCGYECGHWPMYLVSDDEPQTPYVWRDPARSTCVVIGTAAQGVAGIIQRSKSGS